MNPRRRRGFALLPVVLALALLATVAFALSRTSSGSAGRARAAEERDRAAGVAEAGLRHGLWLASQGACSGYDLSETPFGDASYRAEFSPTAGSPVSLIATGTLANGVTHTLEREEQPILEGIQSVVLSAPDDGDDGYLEKDWERNYGAATQVAVSNGSWVLRSLLRFDFSSIPSSARVVGARLSLHADSVVSAAPGARIAVRPVTSPWVEGTGIGGPGPDGATWATWNGSDSWGAPGGDAEPTPTAFAELPSSILGEMHWDVTQLVQQWVEGSRPNYGVLLQTDDAVERLWLASGESLIPGERPRLTVFYGCECGGGSEAVTLEIQPGASGEDTYLDDGNPSLSWGNDALLRISNKTNSQKRGLLHFDLSGIDPTASLGSAELELNLEGIGSAAPATIFVNRALAPWQEPQATWMDARSGYPWSSPGGDFDPLPEAHADIDPALLGPTVWDVTALVADWVADPSANHGIFLLGSDDVNHADFSSSDANATAKRPRLTVTYACGCGTCGPTGFYLDTWEVATCDPAIDYAGSEGTLDWSDQLWTEIGDDSIEPTIPCSGPVKLIDSEGDWVLRAPTGGKGIQRAVDLSTFAQAWLTLEYRRILHADALDYTSVEISLDGGVGWTEVGRLEGPADDASFETAYFDLAPFGAPGSPDAVLRIVNRGDIDGNAEIQLSRVRIDDGSSVPPILPTLELAPDADTALVENDPSTAYGSATALDTGADAGWKRYRTMARFDLASLPADATVVSAELRLYSHWFHGNQDAIVSLYRVTDPWDEATATWNSTGGDPFDPLVPLSSTLVSWGDIGWVEWSVPPGLIHEWRDGVSPNYGLLLEYEGSKKNNRMAIRSREHDVVNLHPQLVIEYEAP